MFDQPLSFNTSSVTSMSGMFQVRSAPAPPPLPMQALACTLLVLLRRPTPSRRPARMPTAPYARLMTRQEASAFNQPLSFDTSSVTYLSDMFRVRSAQARPPLPIQALACTLLAPLRPHALAPPGPHAARTLCPPLDSAVRVGVQPAAELRHVQRHIHELHV